ncbi:GTPase family protein [Streptomyces sp. NPDC001070]
MTESTQGGRVASTAHDFIRRMKHAVERSSDVSKEDREKIARGISEAHDNEPPPTLVLIGETGVGKSTTINALFNAGQEIGHTRATTDHAYAIPVPLNASKGELIVVDMPGLGDDLSNYNAYRDLYLRVLPLADAIVWIHAADDRMVQLIQYALKDLFGRHTGLINQLVFGLNKADEMYPGDWNPRANLPSAAQSEALRQREADFSEKIRAVLPGWRGKAVSYSALKRFNLTGLFREMMHAVPDERRWVLEQRMHLADFTQLVDRKLLKAAQATRLAEVRQPAHASEPPGGTPPGPHAEPARFEPAEQHGNDLMRLEKAIEELSEAELRAATASRARLLDFIKREGRGGAS